MMPNQVCNDYEPVKWHAFGQLCAVTTSTWIEGGRTAQHGSPCVAVLADIESLCFRGRNNASRFFGLFPKLIKELNKLNPQPVECCCSPRSNPILC